MRPSELDILTYAAELLSGAPWNWRATVEYPGFLLVTFTEDVRSYAAGFANPTLTVDQHDQSGAVTGHGVDTKVPCVELDGYRMAIHVAAAIDRMEHDGE